MQPLEKRTLKVGLAGAGSISFNHLVAWKTVPDVKVVAIANPTIQKAQARAAEFGIPAHYDSVAEMLDKHDLDILDIASSRSSHPENIRLAAARGVHILCQKPLANTLAEAEQLGGEVEGVVRLMVNDNRRFRSDFRQIAPWIREGEVGSILQGVMVMFRSGFLPGADGRLPAVVQWPAMAKETRLLIAESLIHQLDVLRFLLGDVAVIACRAKRTEDSLLGETMATIFLETDACHRADVAPARALPDHGPTHRLYHRHPGARHFSILCRRSILLSAAIYSWQSLAAPSLAAVAQYFFLRLIASVIWKNDEVTSILLLFVALVPCMPVFSFFYALAGGWDDAGLEETVQASHMVGFLRPVIQVIFILPSRWGARISPLHNRFPIKMRPLAMAEAQALTEERVRLVEGG